MLIDTSGLLAYHHTDEPEHTAAVRLFRSARRRLVHNYVLAEFVAAAQAKRLPRAPALAFMHTMLRGPFVVTRWVDTDLHQRAVDLLATRLDKTYSLCDAVSFLVMRDLGLTDALTTDHHFEQEGFTALLR